MKLRDLAAAAAASLILSLVVIHPSMDRLYGFSIDSLFWLRNAFIAGKRPPAESDAVVIAIAEKTYRTPPFEGVPRVLWTKQIAAVLDSVLEGGAKVVGFDVVFPTSVDPFLPGFDREFLVALRRGARDGKLILGKIQHSEEPIVPFAGYRFAVGHDRNIRALNVIKEEDGVVRRVPLFFRIRRMNPNGEERAGLVPSMSLELASRMIGERPRIDADGMVSLGGDVVSARPDPGMGPLRGSGSIALHNDMAVNFHRGPASIPTHSLADLFRCAEAGRADFFKEHFQDKAVLFGTVLDVEDRVVTSLRWGARHSGAGKQERCLPAEGKGVPTLFQRETIPGVYVQAAAVNNLLRGDSLRELGRFSAGAITDLLALTMAITTMVAGARTCGVAFALGSGAWVTVATVVFSYGWVLPLFRPIVASGLTLAWLLGYRFAVTDRTARHIRQAFDHYLAPAVVERLVEGNQMPVQGGEMRQMTVWISDLEKYSTLSELMEPPELVEILNRVYTVISDTVEEHSGFVAQFIGDAAVAAFGAPWDDPDHARHGVEAALACDRRVRALALEIELPQGLTLRNRIGISTGPLLVGNIGSK